RTAENGKTGDLDGLSGRMNPEETVSKLRSTPAPSLPPALGAKPEIGPAPNRYAAPVSLIRDPRISEMRSVSQLGDSPAPHGTPRWVSATGEKELRSETVGA
ncbi:MAG: hypothetical protein JW741_31585, partial [Sedimentisphaerales bacterium]|nr:hypothetical protein [Sedimentisphaerales bacterium]